VHVLTKDSVRVVGGGGATVGEDARGGVGAIGAQLGAVGAGIGGGAVIDAAGGLGALAASSPSIAIAASASYLTGLGATYALSHEAGTWLYNNSETVREVAQGTVANIVENGFWNTVGEGLSMLCDSLGGSGGGRSPYMCYMGQ
jgi:hypothetical protein